MTNKIILLKNNKNIYNNHDKYKIIIIYVIKNDLLFLSKVN